MSLDYKWALRQKAIGRTDDEIERLAQAQIRAGQLKDFRERLEDSVRTGGPLWHSADALSDQDVINLFTEMGKRAVELKLHRDSSNYLRDHRR